MKNLKKLMFVAIALVTHTAFASSPVPKMTPQQALLDAINRSNLAEATTAIKNGANVNTPDAFGTTPLMTVSLITFKTMPPIIPYLVSEGASLTAQDHNGCTPLDYALLGFTPATIAFLESKKAPIGTNKLVNAINQNNFSEIEKLLKNGANPNLVVGQGSLLNLLTCSTTANSLQVAELLLKNGANINQKDSLGNTPLIYSVQQNNPQMVALLIRHKADVNLQIENGATALTCAVYDNNLPLTQTLIAAGAKTTPHATKAYNLYTALLGAVSQKTPSLPIVQALLKAPDAKDSINMADSNGWTPLMYAVNANNLPLAQALITAEAKTTPQTNEAYSSDTALLIAVTQPIVSLPIVQALLQAPDVQDSVNMQDNAGYTPLMYAVNANNLPLAQALITAGAKTTLQTNEAYRSDTALLIAVTQKTPSLPMVQALLQAPDVQDSVNMQDSTGWTALMYAANANNLPLTQMLLAAPTRAKTTPCSTQANGQITALMIAINQQTVSLPVVQALLGAPDAKDSINIQDHYGQTALIYAAGKGNLPVVQALIAAGADITITAKKGQTAWSVSQPNCKPALQAAYNKIMATADNNLFNAVLNNDLPGVTKALAAGANPGSGFDLGKGETTSLLISAVNGNNTAIAEALIAAKANVNFQDNKGGTALIYAASNGNLELVKSLLAVGANPNVQTNAANASTTALILAANGGNAAMVEALLKEPTISQSINAKDSTGSTALIYAANAGNEAMVKALAKIKGINANIQDNTGMTALMYAAQNNSLPILQLLVKIPGIQLNLQNNNTSVSTGMGPGSTASDFVSDQNCLNFLTKVGAISSLQIPTPAGK